MSFDFSRFVAQRALWNFFSFLIVTNCFVAKKICQFTNLVNNLIAYKYSSELHLPITSDKICFLLHSSIAPFLWLPYWFFLPLNFFCKNLAIHFQLNTFNHKSSISSLWNKLYHHNCLFETLCLSGLALSSVCLVSSEIQWNSSNKILFKTKSFSFCLNIYG